MPFLGCNSHLVVSSFDFPSHHHHWSATAPSPGSLSRFHNYGITYVPEKAIASTNRSRRVVRTFSARTLSLTLPLSSLYRTHPASQWDPISKPRQHLVWSVNTMVVRRLSRSTRLSANALYIHSATATCPEIHTYASVRH